MNRNTEFLINFKLFIKYYELCLKNINTKYNLSKIEVDIISFLYFNPEFDTLTDIVEIRMLQKGNVSKAITSLIEKNMLFKLVDEVDKRKIHLKLTNETVSITKDISDVKNNYLNQVFKDFSDDEIELYFLLNKKINDNINLAMKMEE